MLKIDTFLDCITSIQGDPAVLALALLVGLFSRDVRHMLIAAVLGGYVRYSFSSFSAAAFAQYYLWAYIIHIMLLSAAMRIARHLLRRALMACRQTGITR